MLYGGTHVNEGEGHYLILAVGPNSRHGIILLLLSQREEEVDLCTCLLLLPWQYCKGWIYYCLVEKDEETSLSSWQWQY